MLARSWSGGFGSGGLVPLFSATSRRPSSLSSSLSRILSPYLSLVSWSLY